MIVQKKIDNLEGQILANELVLKDLESIKISNLWFKKFIGSFTSIFMVSSIVLVFIALMFNSSFFPALYEFLVISFLFSLVFANNPSIFMFIYLKESLGLDIYEKNMKRIYELREKIETDKNILRILKKILNEE